LRPVPVAGLDDAFVDAIDIGEGFDADEGFFAGAVAGRS